MIASNTGQQSAASVPFATGIPRKPLWIWAGRKERSKFQERLMYLTASLVGRIVISI